MSVTKAGACAVKRTGASAAMKNVIVFALGGARFAIELRWVREVITLGFVTPVPGAPAAISGVVNVRGSLTPVLDLVTICADDIPEDEPPLKSPRKGDGAILLEVEGITAAIRVSNVETVTTLKKAAGPNLLLDSAGKQVPLIDTSEIVERVVAAVSAVQLDAPEEERSRGV